MALIQRRGDVNEAANTVFTLNIIFGVFLSAILILLAPILAGYIAPDSQATAAQVVPVLRWLGLSFFISAIGSVHVVWLMRELDYKRKLIPDIASALIKGVVSISLAYAGYGVWALVIGQLSGALSSVILFWVIVPWRPRWRLDRTVMRSLLKYGFSIIGGDLLSVSIDNLGYIIIASMFGLAQLGIYSQAYRLPEMLLIGNLWIIANVTFPAFANIQEKPDELRRGFLASVRLVQMAAVPICLGLIITADPLIRVWLGEQWLAAIPILRVLALYALVTSIAYHIGDIYKAVGRPDILLKLSLLTLLLMIPVALFGSRFGLIGIAWGYVIAIFIDRVVGILVATRFIKITLMDIFNEMTPSIKGGLAMLVVTLPILFFSVNVHPFIQLSILILSGAASYLGVLWWTERENIIQLIRLIRKPA